MNPNLKEVMRTRSTENLEEKLEGIVRDKCRRFKGSIPETSLERYICKVIAYLEDDSNSVIIRQKVLEDVKEGLLIGGLM